MIQRKEILQQAIENGFINETSVYPVILNNCKSSQLQNYSIRGKTEYSENLFNYTEPYNDDQIKADADGWYDVTIDNSSGGSDKEAYCFTKVNLDLKPNTNYYLVLEVAERTGDIDIRPCNDYNGTSQFNTTLRFDSPDVGITPPQKIVSKSTFTDESIRYMLRTLAFCEVGKSGHVKFRIAVYETEKNYFEPYDKYKIPITVTGKNLLKYPYYWTSVVRSGIMFTVNGDGTITLSGTTTLTGTVIDDFTMAYETKIKSGTYTVSGCPEGGALYKYRIFLHIKDSSGNPRYISDIGNGATFTVTSTSTMTASIRIGAEIGTVNNLVFAPQIELGSTATEYEPYHEPVTTNIYRDAQLVQGESINYKSDNLPDITLEKGTNTITANTEVKPLEISASYKSHVRDYNSVKQYGVRWNGSVSTDCERLGDAVGLVANAHLGSLENVQNDFDDIYPWSDIRTCNVDANGNVLAYLGDSSFKRDGSNGDVMVKIPKFYYKRIKSGVTEEFWICERQLPGYQLHPVFMDDGKEVSAVFHSAYNASSYTDTDGKVKLQSITGVQPRVRATRANFRNYARAKGAGWSIEDISCVNALQMLYMIEYASTDSQSKLGKGVSSLNYTATHLAVEAGENTNEFVTSTTNASKYRVGERIEIGNRQGVNNITMTPRTITAITAREDDADISVITFDGDPVASIAVGNMIWNSAPLNGSCDELGGGSGYIGANGRADSAYRGIEGFHGKLLRFIDGVNIKDRLVHYANSIADYADGVYDGKYRAVGYTNGTANGYISEFGYDEKAPWVMFPTEANGGSTIYVPDYYHQNTGERLLALGGYFSYSWYVGVFYFGCNYLLAIEQLNFGAHLLIKKPR